MNDNLSMSQFASKEDFLRAKADLEVQDIEGVSVKATPSEMTITRLVCGVELKMQQSGKHWHLVVKKL